MQEFGDHLDSASSNLPSSYLDCIHCTSEQIVYATEITTPKWL
uniref:Uncharacterized protein n=1 Tax=Arundo donax TaxID=35708 RepID=A0A0A9EXN2_ARUDO